MGSRTLRIVTVMLCAVISITWAAMSIQSGAFVEPPMWLQVFVGALLTGKYVDGRFPRSASGKGETNG